MHENALKECDEVWAAVAYLDNAQAKKGLFLESCVDAHVPLKLYGRYDYSIPVGTEVLKWFLDKKSPNYVCRLVSNYLHAKIIWYRPYGVYIGSANLTQRAWNKNLEAGIFMTQYEIEREGILSEIENYFTLIDENSHDLTQEIYDRTLELHKSFSKKQKSIHDEFRDKSPLPDPDYIDSLDGIKSRKDSSKRKKEAFLKEWYSALQHVRDIADRLVKDYMPEWIDKNASKSVIADQFLHAYYETGRAGNEAKVHRIKHEENKSDPEKALINAMEWWKGLSESIHGVDEHIHEWAPKLKHYFSEDKIRNLSKEEFVDAMTMIHSFFNYARQATCLGKGDNVTKRAQLLAAMAFNEHNDAGQNAMELFHYVLYEGDKSKIPDRIFEVCNDKDKKFPYIGLSTIGEVVGMAIPDDYPPRNGRTSKGLYALGYDVTVHTD
jgi:hypothetical protein